MTSLDFIVMSIFAVIILSIGMIFTKMGSKDGQSFFEGGGKIPWWINGLSLFVSYFSAGTFVVWGSIAYKYGLVSNGIQLTMVLAGLIASLFLVSRWKRTGSHTVAEYIRLRFGVKTQQFYTYLIMLHGLFMTASVLYPVGKMVQLATPFSLETCIIIIGVIIILYTAAGGLWAVLVTDVVQFIVLAAAVLIVIPIAFEEIGGVTNFIEKTPPDFFNFFNSEYSIVFAGAFFIYQTAYIGGNWAYVQRYTSVKNELESRKVGYLFSILYLISPFIWMIPPMIYRVINPNLTGLESEGAYMLLCQKVLPSGLIGLILSGMVSATASKANTTINLVATVFAKDIYKSIFQANASESKLILVARIFTVLFGALTIYIAILVPRVGGIVELVLSVASIAGGAMFIPIIWTLFPNRQTSFTLICTSATSLVINLALKLFAIDLIGFKLSRIAETSLGVGIPIVLICFFEIYNSISQVPKKDQLLEFAHLNVNDEQTATSDNSQNIFGVKVIAVAMAIVGTGVTLLGLIASNNIPSIVVGLSILILSLPTWIATKKM
jgi:solute:Na+ symporter, SSS family